VREDEFEPSRKEFDQMMSRQRAAVELELANMERTNDRLQLAMAKGVSQCQPALDRNLRR